MASDDRVLAVLALMIAGVALIGAATLVLLVYIAAKLGVIW